MAEKLTLQYDRDADILYIGKCEPSMPSRSPKSWATTSLPG